MPLSRAEIIHKIRAEALKQGVSPALALAVADAESSLDPDAVGDNGASHGLFQLQRRAAIDAGIDPKSRMDPDTNIRGGVGYLKQQLVREKGDQMRALTRYNTGTPTYRGIGVKGYAEHVLLRSAKFLQYEAGGNQGAVQPTSVQPSKPQRPSLLARMSRTLAPASAEAATRTALPLPPEEPPTASPAAPHATTPRAGTLPLPPEEPPPAGVSPRDASDVEVQSGPPGTFGAAPPAAAPQPGLLSRLAHPQPPAAAATGIGSPALAAEQQQAAQRPWWHRGLQALAEASPELALSAPDLPQIEQAVTEMTPEERTELRRREGQTQLGVGKTGAATGVSGVTTAIGTAVGQRFGVPWLGAMFGSGVGRGINVLTGLEEKGVGGDVLSVAIPGVQAGYGAAKAGLRGLVRSSRGWKAVTAADEANAAAQKTYSEGTQTAVEQTKAQRQAAVSSQQARETVYQDRLAARRATAETRHQAQEASKAQRVTDLQAEAAQEAQAKTQTQAREYAEQVSRYDQAVASQSQAVGQAKAIPPRYTPETPAHVLYKKVAEIAPEAPVTLARTQEVAAELQDVLGQVPSLQPSRLQALLTDMRAARSTQSVKEVQRYLTDLGTLTRSNDSATRRTAKQLYGALHDDLAESAQRLPETEAARDLLLQANATFRRELATRDLSGVIRRAITVGDDGIPRLAPGRALTQFDRLVEGDKFFAGSFTPDELPTVRSELAGLTTAQKIPPRPGAAPQPVQPRQVEPFTPTPFQPPAPPARRAPYSTWKPDVAAPTPPEPVLPTLPKRDVGALRELLRTFGIGTAAWTAGMNPMSQVALAFEAKDKLGDFLSKMIMHPRLRSQVHKILNADGSLNKPALIALAAGRAAIMAERTKERERDTP